MADRFAGRISIGGKVARKHVKALCKAIEESGAGTDYGDGGWTPKDASELLAHAANCDGTLDLMDDQACYGQFEELEDFLVKHGIAFDRHSEAKYEFDAERSMFRPGMKEPKILDADNGDELMVHAENVMKIVDRMERGASVTVANVMFKEIGDSIEKLKTLCGENIPALEKLEIE